MLPDYEIVPGRGIGIIIFGIPKAELAGILGEPDEIETSEKGSGFNREIYSYNVINCSFSFDQDREGKLVEISIENGYFHVSKLIRVGLKKEDLLTIGIKLKLGKPSFEDLPSEESLTHELISYKSSGLNLYLDDGVISMIQIGVLFKEDNSINWPEENQ